MAAETGPAATLALATLLIVACWKSLRSILGGRDRALRGACLIAALLVPIHGIFDVPGHRITLALSAGLLFALSLRVSSTHASASTPSPWAFRLPALALLASADREMPVGCGPPELGAVFVGFGLRRNLDRGVLDRGAHSGSLP